MENQEHFGRLTDRMATFREEVLEEKPYIDAERAVLATQAYKENQNQPRVMVRALMLQKILENMSIYIEDKSLIAGNQATKNKNAPIFPEYTMEFVMNELDLFEKEMVMFSILQKKQNSSFAILLHFGRTIIFVPEEKLFFLMK